MLTSSRLTWNPGISKFSKYRLSQATELGRFFTGLRPFSKSFPREEIQVEKAARFTVDPTADTWECRKTGDEEYVVEGRPVEILVMRTDIGNEYAVRRMHRQLERMGVIKNLRQLGAKHGDTVRIHGLEFEFSDEGY